jgi:hypothetical protein
MINKEEQDLVEDTCSISFIRQALYDTQKNKMQQLNQLSIVIIFVEIQLFHWNHPQSQGKEHKTLCLHFSFLISLIFHICNTNNKSREKVHKIPYLH